MPILRIERSEVGDKVFFEECPAFAGLGALNRPTFGPSPKLFLAELEKFGGLLQVKGAGHVTSPLECWGSPKNPLTGLARLPKTTIHPCYRRPEQLTA